MSQDNIMPKPACSVADTLVKEWAEINGVKPTKNLEKRIRAGYNTPAPGFKKIYGRSRRKRLENAINGQEEGKSK